MENKINKFTKISTEKIRKTTAEEIGRQVGGRVEMSGEEDRDETKIVEKNKIKKEILSLAKSGQSFDSFEKNELIKNREIKGKRIKMRKGLMKALDFIMGNKTADDYKEMKDEEIKKAA